MMLQRNTSQPQLSLSFLGPLQVSVHNQPVVALVSEKLRGLLAYLAVESNREHPRAMLAGILWPELPEAEALGHLRFAVSNLRRVIGDRAATPPFLCITRQTIRFNDASSHWLDTAAFMALADRRASDSLVNLAQLEQAIALYRGGFLEGFSVHSDTFEEWVLLQRERFHLQALVMMQQLANGYEQSGNFERAQIYARRQLVLEPWREEAHCQLMRALALDGQRSAALAQYETCRRLLARDLRVEPGDETTALYRAIRDGKLQRAPISPPKERSLREREAMYA